MIFDCFPFFNELDLLEIRLHELSDIVDLFVLSEATLTFTGKQKPLYFQENKDRYAKFADKICHVIIDDYKNIDINNPWAMDRWQKQEGLDYLQDNFGLNKNDIVILSDCDEIPKASSIKAVLNKDWDRMAIEMSLFYYYINCICTTRKWRFSQMVRPDKKIKLSAIRGKKYPMLLRDGGWHFGYLNNIKQKINSWAHTEYNCPPYNTQRHIDVKKETGQDLFDRNDKYKFKFLDDLSYLPEYVLSNLDKFRGYIK
jgi:beta-1,4-mannosyl-glycoprotein beta-1,4-N-acetylglucosaminyltransferase